MPIARLRIVNAEQTRGMKKEERRTWVVVRTRDRWRNELSRSASQHSAYDTPEEALDVATTLMTQGAMSVHIIDPSDHVFTPHRFANQVRRQRGRRHKKPRPPNWTGEPG
jgi:hypothetical protein